MRVEKGLIPGVTRIVAERPTCELKVTGTEPAFTNMWFTKIEPAK